MAMTHADLVTRAVRWLKNSRRCPVVLREPVAWSANEIPDAIGFEPRGWAVVVECKTSRADFLSDRRKHHRVSDRNGWRRGMGHERWYMIDRPSLIDKGDELAGWGLLTVRGSRVFKTIKPTYKPRLPAPELALMVAIMRRSGLSARPGVPQHSFNLYPAKEKR